MAQPTTANANDVHPFALLEQQKIQRDIRTRTANKERDRLAIQDIEDGVGYSSDKVLARYFETTRKTIWLWSKDGTLPRPHKIGKNTTRWLNSEVRAMEGAK